MEHANDFSRSTPIARSHGATVSEIPLFPLDLVLFPGMVLPLHIFEPRYRDMIARCVAENIPFGVALIMGQNETTYEAGCTARVLDAERLPDGRYNIEIVGERRFRLLDTHENESYRTGLVEFFDDDPSEPVELGTLAGETDKLLREFLTRSLAVMGQRISGFNLPTEPSQLSFTIACVLPVDNEARQALLEETDTAQRLIVEREILSGEIMKLRRSVEASEMLWAPIKSQSLDSYKSAN